MGVRAWRAILAAACLLSGPSAIAQDWGAQGWGVMPVQYAPAPESIPPDAVWLGQPPSVRPPSIAAPEDFQLLPPVEQIPLEQIPPGLVLGDAIPPATGPPLPPDMKAPPPPKVWEGSAELGLNGSDGNTQVFNLRAGAKTKRVTPADILSLSIDYKKDSSNSLETANRAFFDGRNEWLFANSPWSYFVHETTEYDEFKNFDVRIAADTGFGYQFWKTDTSKFVGRLGAGFSHEDGGPDERWVAEGLTGLSYTREFGKHRKLTAGIEYYPEIEDPNEFRLNSQVAWQMALDDNGRLNVKFGANDRYDSTPNGKRPNDIDYSAVLLWCF